MGDLAKNNQIFFGVIVNRFALSFYYKWFIPGNRQEIPFQRTSAWTKNTFVPLRDHKTWKISIHTSCISQKTHNTACLYRLSSHRSWHVDKVAAQLKIFPIFLYYDLDSFLLIAQWYFQTVLVYWQNSKTVIWLYVNHKHRETPWEPVCSPNRSPFLYPPQPMSKIPGLVNVARSKTSRDSVVP